MYQLKMTKILHFVDTKTFFVSISLNILFLRCTYSKKNEYVKPGKWIKSKKKKMRVEKATVHGNCCWEIRGKKPWKKQKIPFGTRQRRTSVSKVPKARALARC